MERKKIGKNAPSTTTASWIDHAAIVVNIRVITMSVIEMFVDLEHVVTEIIFYCVHFILIRNRFQKKTSVVSDEKVLFLCVLK